jgi:hypothetical protein
MTGGQVADDVDFVAFLQMAGDQFSLLVPQTAIDPQTAIVVVITALAEVEQAQTQFCDGTRLVVLAPWYKFKFGVFAQSGKAMDVSHVQLQYQLFAMSQHH